MRKSAQSLLLMLPVAMVIINRDALHRRSLAQGPSRKTRRRRKVTPMRRMMRRRMTTTKRTVMMET